VGVGGSWNGAVTDSGAPESAAQEPAPEATPRPQTSTRDRADLHRRLVTWLGTKVTDPEVSELVVPESNGMSSETLLFECTWRAGEGDSAWTPGSTVTQACAARLIPDPEAVPVFPVYDLERQFRVLRLVGEKTRVPVPRTLWLELDPDAIGSPFFVMERVEGLVPPDIMPYPFGSWLSEADPADQQRLQRSSVRVLAALHDMDVTPGDIAFLELDRPGDSALRRHVADSVAFYEWVASEGERSPLIERAFAWLEEHWPAEEGAPVISWGDSRIGNMMFRDFEPVAVLDWEMVAVGPREIDIGWMVYLHRFLDDIALQAGLPGMPHFMRLDDVVAAYARHSGHTPRDLDFFTMYAALRHAIVMSRVARRQVLFGEITMPDDPDDMIMHRPTLEQMLEGTYWDKL
jgi:aminoglycoside phosphotransferase (APT) family kinase protein